MKSANWKDVYDVYNIALWFWNEVNPSITFWDIALIKKVLRIDGLTNWPTDEWYNKLPMSDQTNNGEQHVALHKKAMHKLIVLQ